MYREQRITVVIPCYNEERGLPRVLAKIPAEVDEILVLDNRSSDRTVEVALRDPRVRVVQHPVNLGYGGSYLRGLPMASGDVLVTTDGDGTYPVEDALQLVDALLDRGLDFVSASRFPLANPGCMTARNQFGNAVLNFLVRVVYGLKLRDAQTGMWAFRKRVLDRLDLHNTGMAFSNEIKIEAFGRRDVAAAEIPIRYAERIGESKLYPFTDGVRMAAFLLSRRLLGPRRANGADPLPAEASRVITAAERAAGAGV
ncbi:MAG TPA: glycosyltransferase family 2 protein [Candidatus Eisenbacteria bacterium]|nr:glycosyltransferase family 2 protein [Candidatus Eisenbacteria bacterium]